MQFVGDGILQATIMRDLLVKLVTLFTHGSPRVFGGSTTLSVTDRSQGRGDDHRR